MTLIGILLIVIGIAGFSYRYFTYTSDEKLLEIGDVKVTAQKEKAVVIPPLLSGVCLAGGLILVLVARSRKD